MPLTPFPSDDGTEPRDPTPVSGMRLKDAEKIAADRLEGGDGSLKDALADVVANSLPSDEIARLTDRIGAAQAAYTGPRDAATLPFPAEPAGVGAASGPGEQALLGMPEWSEARAAVASELADMQSQPLFLQAEQQQLGGGTHWQPARQDAEPYHPAQHEPVQTIAPEPEPIAEAPRQEPLPRLSELGPFEPVRPQSLNARLQGRLLDEPPEAPLPESEAHRPEPPRPQPPSETAVAPIATALDAAARLAADADVAAAALQNLTRMLQAHHRPASMVPSPMQQAALRPTPARSAEPEPRPRPMAARPTAPVDDPSQMAARPRPEHRPVQRVLPRPAPQYAVTRPVRPPTLRPPPVPRDMRQFDVRGFLAGFVVSCLIGALIYMYLMTG